MLASEIAKAGVAEGRAVRADLLRVPFSDLPPDPDEPSIPIDELPHPFADAVTGDRGPRRKPLRPATVGT